MSLAQVQGTNQDLSKARSNSDSGLWVAVQAFQLDELDYPRTGSEREPLTCTVTVDLAPFSVMN